MNFSTFVYILNDSMISGARYQRVATYSVMMPTSLPAGTLVWMLLANPKSQTLRSQLALRRRLAGFKSRCTMSALWIDFKARRVWYTKYYRTDGMMVRSAVVNGIRFTNLAMVISEMLRSDYPVKIGLHQLLDDWRTDELGKGWLVEPENVQ